MRYLNAKPFLKWAGSKSQLLPALRSYYPAEAARYCEPFLGAGAVLFDVLANLHPREVRAGDINPALVNAFRQVQCHAQRLSDGLTALQDCYWELNDRDQDSFYLEKRDRFNYLQANHQGAEDEWASLFIFLNKTCYNGLYRVNAQGHFNVPRGRSRRPQIVDALHLRRLNRLLENVHIAQGDYRESADFVNAETFIYLDPPYRPLTATAAFTAYDAAGFDDGQQRQVSEFFRACAERGAKVLLSSSDPHNSDAEDDFFDSLYADYTLERLEAQRRIGGGAARHQTLSELLIRNY